MQNTGTTRIKLYDIDTAILTGIQQGIPNAEVMVAIPNGDLQNIVNGDYSKLDKLIPFAQMVKYVAVSNEPDANLTPDQFGSQLVPALQRTRAYLRNQLKIGAKVTVPFANTIVADCFPPSACTINPNLKQYMPAILEEVCKRLPRTWGKMGRHTIMRSDSQVHMTDTESSCWFLMTFAADSSRWLGCGDRPLSLFCHKRRSDQQSTMLRTGGREWVSNRCI